MGLFSNELSSSVSWVAALGCFSIFVFFARHPDVGLPANSNLVLVGCGLRPERMFVFLFFFLLTFSEFLVSGSSFICFGLLFVVPTSPSAKSRAGDLGNLAAHIADGTVSSFFSPATCRLPPTLRPGERPGKFGRSYRTTARDLVFLLFPVSSRWPPR